MTTFNQLILSTRLFEKLISSIVLRSNNIIYLIYYAFNIRLKTKAVMNYYDIFDFEDDEGLKCLQIMYLFLSIVIVIFPKNIKGIPNKLLNHINETYDMIEGLHETIYLSLDPEVKQSIIDGLKETGIENKYDLAS